MGKYAQDFAFSLYQFYVERGWCLDDYATGSLSLTLRIPKGEHQTLLQQDDEYRPLLTKFLDSVGSPGARLGHKFALILLTRRLSPLEIAWVNDLAIGRYQNVTQTLVEEAIKEQNIAQKKVCIRCTCETAHLLTRLGFALRSCSALASSLKSHKPHRQH